MKELADNQTTVSSDTETGKRAFTAGIWYMISNVAVKAMAIITTPIYTRLLSTSDYGLVSTFASWYSLLLVICSIDLEVSVGRAKQDYPNKLEKYIGSIQLLSGVFSAILFAMTMLFIKPVSSFLEMNRLAVIILAVYLLLSPAVSFAQAQYRYEYRYKENIFILFYTTVSTAVLSIGLILTFQQDKWLWRIIGTALPTMVLGLLCWGKGFKQKNISINKAYWKYALAISAPMLIHTISMNLLAQSDRVVITKLIGTEATGIYTLAYQYAILVNIIMHSVNQAWLPWFHDNYFIGKDQVIREKVKPLTILYCFIAVGCVSLAPEAICALGPRDYQDGVWAVPPIVIGVFCQSLYSNYINIELHLKRTKYASYGTIFAAIANIILNIIFIPKYGFVAAAYTTLFSYILLWLIHYYITRFILRVKLYEDWFFTVCFVVVAVLSGICMMYFDRFSTRLVIMCTIGVVFLIYNKGIAIEIINKLRTK